MTKHLLKTIAVSAALLLGGAGMSAYAAGVSVSPSGASVGVGAAGSAASATIGMGTGPLAAVDSNGNPVGGGSQTAAAVNLGTLLAGIDLSGVGVGGGASAGTGGIAGGGGGGVTLSANDRLLLKSRCGVVLAAPANYQADVVTLCRLIAKM